MDPEVSSSDGRKGPSCPSCGREVLSDAVFCHYCGARLSNPVPVPPAYNPYPQYAYQYPYPYYQPKPPASEWEKFTSAIRNFTVYVVFALLLLVSFNVIVLIWGIGQVLPNVAGHGTSLFIITPWLVEIFRLTDTGLAVYFLFLVAAIVLSFVWMLKESLHKFGHELTFQKHEEGHSPLYMTATLFFAVIAFNILFYLVVGLFGSSPSVPGQSADLWQILFSYAQASVWEELITRVLLLGVPLLLIAFATRTVKNPKHYFLGGGFEFGKPELALLLFSSAMFGLAHSFNWDFFKVIPAFFAGLAMGYLFLKFGLYAAIMFHFFTDYLTISIQVWPNNPDLDMGLGLLMLVFIGVGVVYFVLYSFKAFELFTGIKVNQKKPVPVAPAYYPPQQYYPPYYQGNYSYQYPQPPYQQSPPYPQPPEQPRTPDQGFGFICPHCGGKEARYSEGKFECLKCGR